MFLFLLALTSFFFLSCDIVWDQMTRENAEFFEEYYKKLILIDQVEAFNRLVERQCHLQNLASQKASLAPFREGNQHMPGKFLPQHSFMFKT